MSRELITLNERATVEDALKVLINARVTGVPIIHSKTGAVVGVLSEFDIIRSIGKKKKSADDWVKSPIRYSKRVKFIDEETPLNEIVRIFVEQKVRRLPVLNDKKALVGVITRRDLMRVFFYRAKLP
ncbi:MAG: hypothetical protein RJB38_780 [Pseudomonadota bacterium]